MSSSNYIELNGKRYDARTGAFLGNGSQAAMIAPSQLTTTLRAPVTRGTVVDGIVPANSIHHNGTPALTPKPTIKHHIKPIAAHKPERAKTLRRDVVKPPVIPAHKKAVKAQIPTDLITHKPAVLAAAPKLSSEVVDPRRASRAQAIPHSPRIERFRNPPLPRPHSTNTHTIAPVQPSHRLTNNSHRTQITPAATRPAGHPHRTKDDDIFEQALAYARSHEQPAPKESVRQQAKRTTRRHKRAIGIVASTLMVILLGSFIFWQNRADVELQLAAARSGVPASMPAYKPSGFAVKSLTYSPGTVTIGFSSGSKSYNLVQRSSNWDSETLLQNYVATSGQAYSAYQAAGRTVYVYGNGNATWVNGGIWYQVNDSGTLNKDQIINLATSM